jgi:hypothetical protein
MSCWRKQQFDHSRLGLLLLSNTHRPIVQLALWEQAIVQVCSFSAGQLLLDSHSFDNIHRLHLNVNRHLHQGPSVLLMSMLSRSLRNLKSLRLLIEFCGEDIVFTETTLLAETSLPTCVKIRHQRLGG